MLSYYWALTWFRFYCITYVDVKCTKQQAATFKLKAK